VKQGFACGRLQIPINGRDKPWLVKEWCVLQQGSVCLNSAGIYCPLTLSAVNQRLGIAWLKWWATSCHGVVLISRAAWGGRWQIQLKKWGALV
jgi:hypothetical protein